MFCDIFPRNERVLRRNIEIKAENKKKGKVAEKKGRQKKKELKPSMVH